MIIPDEETNLVSADTLIQSFTRDFYSYKPISDEIFNIYSGMFKYDKMWIIGGESIYNRFINTEHIDKIFLTEIDQEFECDTFFPHIPSNFKLLEESNTMHEKDISYKFKVYKNLGNIDYDVENHKWCETQFQVGLD